MEAPVLFFIKEGPRFLYENDAKVIRISKGEGSVVCLGPSSYVCLKDPEGIARQKAYPIGS